jgi:sugar O-acyltransferase (sialic acid O-acetyltransferase NeuD family)
MDSIYILGSSGFAKEVYFLINSIGSFTVKGFIDIEAKQAVKIGKSFIQVYDESYLETLDTSVHLAIGMGNPALIEKLTKKFADKLNFPNLVHPNTIGNFEDIQMGQGNIITANCIFTTTINIGSFNIFNLNCTIGHDVEIGNCNVINPGVNISGGVKIGDRNLLGVNSTILQFKSIGNDVVVGASSMVNKDVPDQTTVVGIPAKPLNKS